MNYDEISLIGGIIQELLESLTKTQRKLEVLKINDLNEDYKSLSESTAKISHIINILRLTKTDLY